MIYLFELGHQPSISLAEIQTIFSALNIEFKIEFFADKKLIIETKKIDPIELNKKLGGTVKISEKISQNKDAINFISDYLNKKKIEGKIEFSIKGENAENIALKIKKELKSQGRSVRYVEPKNTATILYNKLVEKESDFTILPNGIFVTRSIQPIENFSKRDYGRPGSDSLSGMLPPKLARIMINLSNSKNNDILLDPFCGSGTILMEALDLGFKKIIGSDISEKAIKDTEINIKWLKETYNLPKFDYKLLKTDVKKLADELKPNSINTIITEPYLGKPLKGNETEEHLLKQATELKKLYTESFENFKKILTKNGVIIFIIPCFRHLENWIRIDCKKEIEKNGFETMPLNKKQDYLLYWRPKQFVGREIWKFKKQ